MANMTRFTIASPHASDAQLLRASSAARAAADRLGVDAFAASRAYGDMLSLDDSGLPPSHLTKEQGELVRAFFEIEGAAKQSLLDDGVSSEAVVAVGLGLRDEGPDDLQDLVRDALWQWLSRRIDADHLYLIQHGGLSAGIRQIGTGPESYLLVHAEIGVGTCTSLASFGQLQPGEVLLPHVIEYARKWNRALPAAPSYEQVLGTMTSHPTAAWEYQRHQLETEAHWVTRAAEELGQQIGRY